MGAVSSRARYLFIVPMVAALLDLGETVSILLLTNFPDITDAQIVRASTLTVAKWWMVVLMLLVAFGQFFVRLTMLPFGQLRR